MKNITAELPIKKGFDVRLKSLFYLTEASPIAPCLVNLPIRSGIEITSRLVNGVSI